MFAYVFGGNAASLKKTYQTIVAEAQVTVGTSLVVLLTANAAYGYLVNIRNSSTGAQNLRIGGTPAFGTPAGQMLLPGESITLYDISITISAIASAAGGLADVFIARTL